MSTGPTTLPASGDTEQPKRRRLPRLRDVRIRSKLALILVVPVAAVLALATVRLVAVGENTFDANQARALTALSIDVSALTQDLHAERMAAAAFLSTPQQKADAYNLRVRSTDERVEAYRAERGRVGDVPTAVRERLSAIDEHLETLAAPGRRCWTASRWRSPRRRSATGSSSPTWSRTATGWPSCPATSGSRTPGGRSPRSPAPRRPSPRSSRSPTPRSSPASSTRSSSPPSWPR